MKHNHALYPIIMSSCAFVCFLGVVLLMADTVQPLWGRTLLPLLPALILCAVGLFALKGKLNKNKTVILTTILAIVLFLASVFYFFLLSIWTATTETTDIRYYSRAYDEIDDEDGVKGIFPNVIPKFAADISFSYTPQFLQGGEVFELSYTTTDGDLSEWKSLLEKKAEWVGTNQQWHEENSRSIPGTDLSTRYHLYWDGGFNHGEMCYVLIDAETSRITFYYSEW